MKNSLIIFLSLSIHFLINSCSGPVVASKITDISQVKAEVNIYQSLTDKKDNSVSVILYDKKGKKIGTDSITIRVNRQKADYKIMQQLYYSKNYYYRIEKLQPENEQYTLEIQLSNGKKYFLGNISTLKLSDPHNIITPEEASLQQDLSISWSHLYDVNALCIYRSFENKNDMNNNTHTFIEEPTDTLKIGTEGNYSIKKEKFSKPEGRLSVIGFKFTAQKEGKLNPLLLKGSYIKISGYHEKRVSFK
nr:hypothetical protein [uncultured Chryseobacterium sp.]